MNIKVVIAGGTGFVGQGIIKQLSSDKFEVHSLSRHAHVAEGNDQTIYHAVNLAHPQEWQHIIHDADWVIDAVGILLPNPMKGSNYQNSSYEPAKHIIDMLIKETKPNFLFISANAGPFFMKPYLKAKRAVESDMKELLTNRSYTVYPGVIFDKARCSSYIPGVILSHLTFIPYVKKLRPVKRERFAREVAKILLGEKSYLETKI